jgi:glycosyltransferase 2 family protein
MTPQDAPASQSPVAGVGRSHPASLAGRPAGVAKNRRLGLLFTVARLGIGVALLVYLGRSGLLDWAALRGFLVAWPITVLAVTLLLLAVVVMAARVCVLMAPSGLHLSLGASVRLTFIGMFFNACLPGSTGGDALRIYYASRGNTGRRTEVATIFVLDRVVGLFALLLWPLLAAPFFPGLVAANTVLRGLLGAAAVAAAIIAALFFVAGSPRALGSSAVGAVLARIPGSRYIRTVLDTLAVLRGMPGTLASAVGISLIVHTIGAGVVLLVAQAINPAGAAWEMSLLIPLGSLANTVPLTPGGLGVGEAVLDRLFTLAGLSGGAETMLGWRVLLVGVSLLGLVFYLQGGRRFVYHARVGTGPS